jgi:hypothetical protein
MMVLFAIVTLGQLAMLCFFGERIITASDDIKLAAYDCDWLFQPLRFKKTLVILRTMAHRTLNIKACGVVLCHRTFARVIESFACP